MHPGLLLLFVSYLSELLQVEFQGLHVHVEAQRGHGEQDVLPVDGLPLLLVAALARLRRDEADKLAHALLHALLGIFGNLWETGTELKKKLRTNFCHSGSSIRPFVSNTVSSPAASGA